MYCKFSWYIFLKNMIFTKSRKWNWFFLIIFPAHANNKKSVFCNWKTCRITILKMRCFQSYLNHVTGNDLSVIIERLLYNYVNKVIKHQNTNRRKAHAPTCLCLSWGEFPVSPVRRSGRYVGSPAGRASALLEWRASARSAARALCSQLPKAGFSRGA